MMCSRCPFPIRSADLRSRTRLRPRRSLVVVSAAFSCAGLSIVSTAMLPAQSPSASGDTAAARLELSEFRPEPSLVVPRTTIGRARFPIVDVHSHFRIRRSDSIEALREYVAMMDRRGIALSISLDGGTGDALREHLRRLDEAAPGRFLVFAHLDFRGDGDPQRPETWACNRSDFIRDAVERLREAKTLGAVGLKFFKELGLGYRHADGSLWRIDDPRLDPIWQVCGELGFPVLIHTADPSAFFRPIDATNERWEELERHPDWSFHGRDFPSRDELHAQRNRVIERHPGTRFIAAHLGNDGEDLAQAAEWLERYPNLMLEFASRISELGRQPYSARRFLRKYRERILFGTDGPWPEERVELYLRFLETEDEYFPYSEKPFPPQGFWRIYGVGLDDATLRSIAYENARELFPAVAERLDAQGDRRD